MSEENQNQPEPSLEGFVPESPDQGTPPETPPETVVSDDQKPVVETPAQPDSPTEVTDGATSTKTPEQIEADKAYHQQQGQEAKAELDRIRAQFAQQEPPLTAKSQSATTSQTQPDRAWLSQLTGLSNEEINDKLRDDPMLQLQLADYQQEQRLNSILDKRDAQTRSETQYAAEAQATNKHLDAFCVEHKIPREELHKIKDELVGSGIKGSPAAIGGLIQDRLNFTLAQKNVERRGTEAAAKAAQAVKTQSLTIQPDGSGSAPAEVPKTTEERIAANFKPSAGKEAINQLFG